MQVYRRQTGIPELVSLINSPIWAAALTGQEPREVKPVKRVHSACIFQTLVFAQKEDCGLSIDRQRTLNREEVANYKQALEAKHTRYQITEEIEQSDGSVLLRVRKQYNDKADVSEYFD